MLNSIFEERSSATQQVEQTRQQILNHQLNQGVIVMVSHYANIVEITGTPLQEGEIVVLRANQQGDLKVVGRIQD